MIQKSFWEIFYDRDTYQFEVVRISQDDTEFTLRVCELQRSGKNVNCNTPPSTVSKEDIIADMKSKGYKHIDGLYGQAIAYLHKE